MAYAESRGTQIQSGTLANRPVAGIADRYYSATDIGVLFRDNGVAWDVVAVTPFRRYYPPLTMMDSNTIAFSANTLLLTPFEVLFTVTVDRICQAVSNGVGNHILGIYADNGDQPDGGILLRESGVQAPVGTAKEEYTIAALQLTPGLYWTAYINDNAAQSTSAVSQIISRGGTLFGRFAALVFPANLPNPCPATAAVAFHAPIVFFRVQSVP